jgi:hypothetical protein
MAKKDKKSEKKEEVKEVKEVINYITRRDGGQTVDNTSTSRRFKK